LAVLAAATAVSVAGSLAAAPAAQAASDYTLITLPDDGQNAIYNFINSATSTLDMTMYELSDTTAEQDLVADAQRGVTVKVILDGKQTSKNGPAYSYLSSNGVGVVYSSSRYYYTHEKSLVADGDRALILTGNLDSTYYSSDRDFGVVDTDATDAAAIQNVFNADYAGTAVTPGDGDDLVWSPTDSQSQLLSLINGAQHSLLVEEEEFGDTTLVNALVAAENRGVSVRVVTLDESSYDSNFNAITGAGGSVSTYDPNGSFYIHAKAIVADYGTSAAKIFLGSENFSSTSLNQNRELGLIISDSAVMSSANATITSDFNNGTPW
jgi:phosphatidylserine/phosphatidylglycerophosphate/cardiolipin synthase-like enzyme